jgi:tetratricopeptide (TPR) repeat protein
MSRCSIAFLALVIPLAAQQTPPPKSTPEHADDVQLPPEEDKSEAPKEYVFNPLQSQKEVGVGEEYFKKGNFHAAANRFREGTRWNDGNSQAWLRLAETEEKNHNTKDACEAYQKYLQLAPEAKNAADVKKRVAKACPGSAASR